MFGLQPWHLIVILAVALLVFGPSRLPEIGQAIGKSIREFRDAASSAQESLREGMDAKPVKKIDQDEKDDAPKA
ncbi:MAG: twin-arginine translocase TatA/TatE family subunit [Anaerolineae bacterium]